MIWLELEQPALSSVNMHCTFALIINLYETVFTVGPGNSGFCIFLCSSCIVYQALPFGTCSILLTQEIEISALLMHLRGSEENAFKEE